MEQLARTTSRARVIDEEIRRDGNGARQLFTVITDEPVNTKDGNVWVSTEKPPMAALEDVKDYLHRHPTPWRIANRLMLEDGRTTDVVNDAHGREIFGTEDQEGYLSWFTGDVSGVVNMVNTLAEVLEVEGEPRPATIDPANIGMWAELEDGTLGIITRLHHWNQEGREDCYLTVPGKTEALLVTSDEVTVREDMPRVWGAEGAPVNE